MDSIKAYVIRSLVRTSASRQTRLFSEHVANDVDGVVLHVLNDDILESKFRIGSFGRRYKIMKAILKLFSDGECEWLVVLNTAHVSFIFAPNLFTGLSPYCVLLPAPQKRARSSTLDAEQISSELEYPHNGLDQCLHISVIA